MGAIADSLNLDPRERQVFLTDPEAWAKQNATRYGAHVLSPGSGVTFGTDATPTAYNPRFWTNGATNYRGNADGSVSDMGNRPLTPQELIEQFKAQQPKITESNPFGINAVYPVGSLDFSAFPSTGRADATGQPATITPDQGVSPSSGDPSTIPMLGGAGTRANRNNNPGNIRGGGAWQGMTGQDGGGFDIFDTPENGQRAAGINLANQTRLHGITTLSDLASKWAPSTDGNNTAAYIQTLSQLTGIGPNQPVDFSDAAMQSKVLPAIYQIESGGTPARAPAPPLTLGQGVPQLPPSGSGRILPTIGSTGQLTPVSSSVPTGIPRLSSNGNQAPRLSDPQSIGSSAPRIQNIVPGVPQAVQGADSLDPQTLDYLADQYHAGRGLPSLGNGKSSASIKTAIIARAVAKYGQGLDAGAAATQYKADQGALTQLTKTRGMIDSFENTVQRNLGIVDGLIAKGPGTTGIPVLNRVQQHIRGQYAGDPDVTAWETALNSVTNEYAKVMSGGTGSGPTSDNARAKAESLLDPMSHTPDQIKANMAIMSREMTNRRQGLDDEIKATQDRISVNSQAVPSNSPSTPPTLPPKGASMNDAQRTLFRSVFRPGAAYGAQDNPYIVSSAATYAPLPRGAWYIDPNGKRRQKK